MNKVLSIPKYKVPYNDGYTIQKSDPYIKHGSDFLLLESDSNLFYRVIPFLIFECNGLYLVNEYESKKYTLNICDPTEYIMDSVSMNPIKDSINNYMKKYVLKSKVTYDKIKYAGVIKSTLNNPNDIVFLYIKSINTKDEIIKKKYTSNYKWYNLEELINKARRFDGFSLEYINYLVSFIIK